MTWYEILFLKYLKGLPSRINLLLRTYVNGTEQLLPVNDDEPETSPILCDIQYPDILRDDQYFTYRESPTTKDGLAKIRGIRGNTLVWNQLITSTNIRETRTVRGVVFTNNNNGSITLNGTAESTNSSVGEWNITTVSGHKYIFTVVNDSGKVELSTNSEKASQGNIYINEGVTYNITYYPYCIDLTKMFGSGNEPTTVAEFTSLFPLPYYAYNTGSLLSFTGTGIKTVGFNQWDEEWESGSISGATGEPVSDATRIRSKNYIDVFPNKQYYVFNGIGTRWDVFFYDSSKTIIGNTGSSLSAPFTTPSNCFYIKFRIVATTYSNNICINISNINKNGTYEPYTTSTLSLPISTYFPTGMKSAGSVYDELTPTRAITRIGAVDLGSLTWTYNSTSGHLRFTSTGISTLAKKASTASTKANAICSIYETVTENDVYSNSKQGISITSTGNITVYDTSYTDATTFKSAMDGVYLFYELATPTEQNVSPEDTQVMLNQALSTILGRSVSVQNPQEPLDILTKGE